MPKPNPEDTGDAEPPPTYSYRLTPDPEQGGFFAEHPELEGCAAQGETADETIANLDAARELWIEIRLEDGLPVPQPAAETHSGRISLRVAASVHSRLAQYAQAHGLSLNKLLNRILSDSVNGLGPLLRGPQDAASVPVPAADAVPITYPYDLTRDEQEGGYFAEHPDLPGCAAQGETADEAIANLDVARELWIETRLEDGLPVPEPMREEHSGLISLRMSRFLHADLVRQAARNRVSLNLWLNTVLAEFVGGLIVETRVKREPGPEGGGGLTSKETGEAATCLFRAGHRKAAEQLLSPWPQGRRDFLLGLLHLEVGEGPQTIRCLCSAYSEGLDFDNEGKEIYDALPDRPDLRVLKENLLPFFLSIDDFGGGLYGQVGARFLAWMDGLTNNQERRERWLQRERSRFDTGNR
jgi:antitoxin HicB